MNANVDPVTNAERDAILVNAPKVPTTTIELAEIIGDDVNTLYATIPPRMQEAQRWLLWRLEHETRKVPYYVNFTRRHGKLDGPGDQTNLATLEQALEALKQRPEFNLGFALGPDGNGNCWQGIDLDHADQHPGHADLLARLPGYRETSPSGTGYHAIGYGPHFSALGSNDSGIEAYSNGRYFTFTGQALGGDIEDLAPFVVGTLAPLHREGTKTKVADPSDENVFPLTPIQVTELRSALNSINPDDRGTWVAMGQALVGQGDTGKGLWLDWSQMSPKWQPQDALEWETFRGNYTGYAAVFAEAQRQGWVNPASKSKPQEAVATLERAITALADDPGAVLTDQARSAWGALYGEDPAEFERLRSRAKAAGARVSEIDKLVGARNKRLQEKKKTNIQQTYTSYTSNISNDLAEDNSSSLVYEVLDSAIPYTPGMLVEGSDKPKLMIVSDAALVARDAMRGRYARSTEAAAWHHFTGTHWEPAPSAAGVHQALTAWLYPTTTPLGFTPHYQDALLTLLERGNMLPLPESPPGQLPFQNGILTLATLEFKPITPASAATWCLPYDYTPGADCPTIKAWLKMAVDGDEPTVELLRAWWAALLTGRADLQKFLHLPGPGGTGKGTFTRICEALVGSHNTAATDLKTLEQNRFEAASLYRKRLVLISDTDKYGGSVNVLKALTGQDAIRLERKNVQQNGTFRFDGQVLIASNEALATTDLTSGLERRRITVAFRRQVSDAEREQWRKAGGEIAVLHREIPGLVNWVLSLLPEQVSAAITSPPDRTREQNLDALTAGNSVAGWLVECVKPEAGAWTQIGSKDERRRPEDGFMYYSNAETMLYPSYLAWSRRTGRSPVALRRFRQVAADMARTLGASIQEVRRGAGMGIEGLRLLDTNDEPYAWSISSSGVGSVASGAQLQDQIAPKPLSLLEVQDMQDFRPNFDSLPATTAIGQESGAAEIWI